MHKEKQRAAVIERLHQFIFIWGLLFQNVVCEQMTFCQINIQIQNNHL